MFLCLIFVYSFLDVKALQILQESFITLDSLNGSQRIMQPFSYFCFEGFY